MEKNRPTPPNPDSQGKMSEGSTAKYRDRPTDDGMKGDGAEEPNAGSPRLPRQKPSRRTHTKPSH